MRRTWLALTIAVASVALYIVTPAANAQAPVKGVALCEVLPNGRAVNLTVPQRAAWPLIRTGVWEGSCALRHAASLQGRVLDVNGRPVAGVCVEVDVVQGGGVFTGTALTRPK